MCSFLGARLPITGYLWYLLAACVHAWAFVNVSPCTIIRVSREIVIGHWQPAFAAVCGIAPGVKQLAVCQSWQSMLWRQPVCAVVRAHLMLYHLL